MSYESFPADGSEDILNLFVGLGGGNTRIVYVADCSVHQAF
jgi:hypothetical protein